MVKAASIFLTVILAMVLWATLAMASDTTLVVLPNRTEGMTIEQADSVYSSVGAAARDTDAFLVVPHAQLAALAGDIGFARALACSGNAECLADLEELEGFDFIIVVDVARTSGGVVADLSLVDRFGGRTVSTQQATMAAADDDISHEVRTLLASTGLVERPAPLPSPSTAPDQPPTTPHVAEPEPQPVERYRPTSASDWLLIGGAAGIASGTLLAFAADATQQEIQARPHDRETLEDLQARGQREQVLGNVLIFGGIAAVGTGIVLAIVGKDGNDDPARGLSLAPTRGGLMLGAGTRF